MDLNKFGTNALDILNIEDKQLEHNSNPFYHSSVIPPPKKDKLSSNIRYERRIIDSRDRNLNIYPRPSKYQVYIEDEIKDLVSLELLSTDIPFPRYLIHDYNNVLHIQTNLGLSTINVSPGNYNETQLETELNQKLLDANLSINVVYNEITEKYYFESNTSFSLLFKGENEVHTNNQIATKYKTNTIGKVIGFDNNDFEAEFNGSVWTLHSKYIRNFRNDTYIVMKIGQVKINKGTQNSLNDSFVLINRKDDTTNNSYDNQVIKKFNPPLVNLNNIKISFYDYYGNEYDFQNQDHRIEFIFGTLKQMNKYQNIFE